VKTEKQSPAVVISERLPEPFELLTAEEAAALLRVNVKSIYAAVSNGAIPGVRRIGSRTLRFSRRTLVDWFQTGHGLVPNRRGR
jgi:excisionase family DNA binding protein